MELKYDSIFQVLNRIQHDPKIVIKSKSPYQNVIQLFIADDTEIEHADVFFPANKLMVNRLPDDFIKNHRALFKTYWEKAGKPAKNETVIIEDSTNGIKAANQAEIPVIMVPDYIKPTTFEKEHTLAIKSDLNEVIDFIK